MNFANSAAVAAAAAAARLGRGKPPGTIDCDDHGGAGSYSRLFGLKHPGSSNHRRVGVDPLGEFKKEHYRVSMAGSTYGIGMEKTGDGGAGGVSVENDEGGVSEAVGRGAGAGAVGVLKPGKPAAVEVNVPGPLHKKFS